MASAVSGIIKLTATLSDVRSAVAGALKEGGVRSAVGDYGWTIASGTTTGLADKIWSDQRTVTTGATDSIDLAGTLTDSFGETVTFVKVKGILISSAAANTTTLQIARPASNGVILFGAASGALAVLSAGGFFCWVDPAVGVTVTTGTGDLLSIINSAGASAVYDIMIVGTSA